ncbi:ABC transporter permease [candidate division FCPU426 bacterium]|nr:ABC transporter permease [candidate division FCPU426 bacterium]
MKNKILKIALQNVLKHKRRTFFNALTVAANAFALIMLIGMLNGMYNSTFERSIDLQTGHFKIYQKDYLAEKNRMPLEYNIDQPYQVIADIQEIPYFVAAAPRITHNAIVSNTRNKTGIVVIGIDMEQELKTTKLFEKIPPQEYLAQNRGEILVGRRLSELFKTAKGDFLLLYSQTVYKANNLVEAVVKGIYSIGFEKMERSIAFVPLAFAQEFFDMEQKATEIIIRIKERKYVPPAQAALEKIIKNKYPSLVVSNWKQEASDLIAGARADFISYGVVFAILLFLAVFIIMNTLTITVFERTAEIGTVRAIGLEANEVRWMFLFEGIYLALIGAIIGGILAIPMAYYMNVVGMSVPADLKDKMPFPIEAMVSKNTWWDWLLVTGICLGTGMIGAVLPANRAAQTKIVDALKKGVR